MQIPPPPKPPIMNDLYGPVKLYFDKIYRYMQSLRLVQGQNISITTSSTGQTISANPDENVIGIPFFGSFDGIYYTRERGSSQVPTDLSFEPGDIHFDNQQFYLTGSVDLNTATFNALDVTREFADVWVQVTAGEILLAEFKTGEFPGFNIAASPLLFNYHLGVLYKFLDQSPLVYQWHQTLVGDIHLHLEQTPGLIDPPYEDDVEVFGRNIWSAVANPAPKQFEVYHLGGSEGRPGGPLVAQATLNLVDSVTAEDIVMEIHGNHILSLEIDGSPVDIDPPPVDPYPDDFEITLAIDVSSELDFDDAVASTLDVTPNNALGTQDVIYFSKVNNQVIDISLTNDDTNLVGSITRIQASADDVYTLYFRGLRCHYNSTVDYFAKLANGFIVQTSATTRTLTMTVSTSSTVVLDNLPIDIEAELKGAGAAQFSDFDGDGDYEIHVSARFVSDNQVIKIDTIAFENPPDPPINPGELENLEFVPRNYDTGKSGLKENIFCIIPEGRGGEDVEFTITLLYFPLGCILVDPEILIPGFGLFKWSDNFNEGEFNTDRWAVLVDLNTDITWGASDYTLEKNVDANKTELAIRSTAMPAFNDNFSLRVDFSGSYSNVVDPKFDRLVTLQIKIAGISHNLVLSRNESVSANTEGIYVDVNSVVVFTEDVTVVSGYTEIRRNNANLVEFLVNGVVKHSLTKAGNVDQPLIGHLSDGPSTGFDVTVTKMTILKNGIPYAT